MNYKWHRINVKYRTTLQMLPNYVKISFQKNTKITRNMHSWRIAQWYIKTMNAHNYRNSIDHWKWCWFNVIAPIIYLRKSKQWFFFSWVVDYNPIYVVWRHHHHHISGSHFSIVFLDEHNYLIKYLFVMFGVPKGNMTLSGAQISF